MADTETENTYMGSYNFQGGETGYFSMKPYGEGDCLAEIKFLAPAGAENITLPNDELGWKLSDGTILNLTKGLFTRRLGDVIEPVIKDPREPGKMLPIAYEVTYGSMTIDDDWSFLDCFN